MKTFSRLILFTITCIAMMVVGITPEVYAQEPSLEVSGDKEDQVYALGDSVTTNFTARIGGVEASGEMLDIEVVGLTNVTITNGGITNASGLVVVMGTIVESGAYIKADWTDKDQSARADFPIPPPPPPPEQLISSLEVSGDTGKNQVYALGDSVETNFTARIGGVEASGEILDIEHGGLTNVTITNGGITNASGLVVVTGTIVEPGAYIRADWKAENKWAEAVFQAGDTASILLIVNSPEPDSNLGIGDTFTQEITIENRDLDYATLPLSAWQMDIVFNPAILQVTGVSEGGFLEQNGADALFIGVPDNSSGRVKLGQALTDQDGIALNPGDQGSLATITFEVKAYAEEALGVHNVVFQSDVDRNDDTRLDRISYSILVRDVFVATELTRYIKEDVNQDGVLSIQDLMLVAQSIGTLDPRTDISGDGFVNVLDIVLIYNHEYWGLPLADPPLTLLEVEDPDKNPSTREANRPALAAPPLSGNVTPDMIQNWIDDAQIEDDGSEIFERGIANLESLLKSKVPTQTRLLRNYPNPFNPETWIPYQLAESTKVTVTIHSMNGSLIRSLDLGHQAPGSYISKSQAAYWDGRNEFGEQSASGLYFYTFTAGKFTATGKMLIIK